MKKHLTDAGECGIVIISLFLVRDLRVYRLKNLYCECNTRVAHVVYLCMCLPNENYVYLGVA
jgi:hypothetical protein